jgi:hypothetical protein
MVAAVTRLGKHSAELAQREINGSGPHNYIKKRLQELISFMLSCTKLVSSMTIK